MKESPNKDVDHNNQGDNCGLERAVRTITPDFLL